MPRRPAPDNASVEIDGYKLRNLRKLQGYSIKGFAEKARISYGYVSQLETGNKTSASPEAFGRICDALSIDADKRYELMSPASRRRAIDAGVTALAAA